MLLLVSQEERVILCRPALSLRQRLQTRICTQREPWFVEVWVVSPQITQSADAIHIHICTNRIAGKFVYNFVHNQAFRREYFAKWDFPNLAKSQKLRTLNLTNVFHYTVTYYTYNCNSVTVNHWPLACQYCIACT